MTHVLPRRLATSIPPIIQGFGLSGRSIPGSQPNIPPIGQPPLIPPSPLVPPTPPPFPPGPGVAQGDRSALEDAIRRWGPTLACKLFPDLCAILGVQTGGQPPGLPQIPTGPCDPGLVYDPQTGACYFPGSPGGRGALFGEAVMGRYGAGIVPASVTRFTMQCPAGSALGKDNICYDHLPNRDRKYPRGRRPLLTGGEMRAISRAAGAARKLKGATKRLKSIGLLKTAAPRRTMKQLPPAIVHHAVDV